VIDPPPTPPHVADLAELVTVETFDGLECLVYRAELESDSPRLTLYRWTGLSWPSFYEGCGAPVIAENCYIDRASIKRKAKP